MQLLASALLAFAASTVATFVTADDVLLKPYASLLASPLDARQEDGSSSNNDTTDGDVPDNLLKPDGTINMTSFLELTSTTCLSRLSNLRRTTSPSGMSICFNLPSLNTTSGVFEADLRLYKVTEPRDAWEGIEPGDVDVNVGFANARVRNVTEQEIMGIGMVGELQARQADDRVQELQRYMLVGQVQGDKLDANMTMSAIEALLMPTLSLTALSPQSSDNLTTLLSPNEASFITGVFSDLTPQSSFSLAQAAVSSSLALLDEGEVAFILPGTQILIFPIGLIITGTWALLGVGVYAFGTVERWRFRESYRERVKGGVGGAGI
ncbi:uncharacterized protein J7T54_007180 [Emericellopsis cladophorae]|uniref:Protein BIG1 n=1 Tax=Emericellopsis cladophorae TaxID=2686198 RepID=A0A9Q0BGZ4_9HYPO|nr:uncharacterized protein J7T54_007180 [Emericellopsis cladophorae]KAI6785537.1 hypothetical protein J7T54_007180 [Emericellopsis cladophorae]